MSKWLYVKNHYFQRAEFLSIYSDAWPLSRSWSTVNSTPVEDVFIPMQITEEAGVWQGRLWCPRVSHLKTLVPLMVHLASHVVVERGAWQVEERCQMERKPGQIRVWTESFLVQAAVILHIRMGSGGGGGGWQGLQWVREGHHRITGLSLSWVGKIPGEGNGNLLEYSCLENPMDGGAWQATVHEVARIGHDWATSLHFSDHRKTLKIIWFNACLLVTPRKVVTSLWSEN